MELQSVDASEKQKLKELKDFVAIETEKMEEDEARLKV